MSITFSIRVVDEDGDPRSGCEVHLDFGLLTGYLKAFTGSDGWANFETGGKSEYHGVTVYIDGDSQGTYSIEDRTSYSFTI